MSLRAVFGGALGSGAIATLFIRRYLQEVGPPRLVHGGDDDGSLEELLFQLRALFRDYRPHPIFEFSGLLSTIAAGPAMALPDLDIALGGRLQTWGLLTVVGRLEELRLSDGGTVSLQWGDPPPRVGGSPRKRFVLLLPGLNNSGRTPYIQAMLQHLQHQGFHSAALNYRGIAGTPLTTQRVGCADSWQDLPEVFEHIQSVLPGAVLFAVGYSMGGSILLRHLGEQGDATPLRAAATVAAPVDTKAVVEDLEATRVNRVFNYFLTKGAAHTASANLKAYPQFAALIDHDRLHKATTIRDADAAVICPLNGYARPEDYWENSSALPKLHRIARRTLLLHAEDDPVVAMSTIPLHAVRANPQLLMSITRRGGHISWTGSGKAAGTSWVDRVVTRFFLTQGGDAGARMSKL